MFVYNLEKLNEDGFKQEATDITHARLYYDDFTGSNYVQGTFRTGSTSIIQFNNSGVQFTLFKMFTSTDGVTYTERESFGGDNGTTLIDTSLILDPNDYSDALPYPKYTEVNGVKMFVPGAGGSGTAIGTGVDYLYCRGFLSQNNLVNSGKAFFGYVTMDTSTGLFNTAGDVLPELTIADSYSKALSAKISTGIYKLQFRSNLGAGVTNSFVQAIVDGASTNYYIFESSVFPVYNKSVTVYNGTSEQYDLVRSCEFMGTVVLDIHYNQYSNIGLLYVKTYNAAGTLADDILNAGVTVEFKAFPNLYLG